MTTRFEALAAAIHNLDRYVIWWQHDRRKGRTLEAKIEFKAVWDGGTPLIEGSFITDRQTVRMHEGVNLLSSAILELSRLCDLRWKFDYEAEMTRHKAELRKAING